MKLIELTLEGDDKILVNFENVTHVIASDGEGSIVHTVKDSGYRVIGVKEKLNEIQAMVNH